MGVRAQTPQAPRGVVDRRGRRTGGKPARIADPVPTGRRPAWAWTANAVSGCGRRREPRCRRSEGI
ncbi:hypothetical protein HMPREF0043_00018 [Actinobaculum sp. oral taxon 183 str. F0552]|nr:hypothetical protein HMPREF0043_00018 [Actinobaculum sp. oral taxon 183 str. F0552]